MEWTLVYFNDDLLNAISALPPSLLARFIHLTERMETFGPDLGMPHTRPMGKGLYELRMKGKEGIARVFFCNRPNRRIMMLHVFVKKSAKTPANELRIARQRMNEIQP